uniref:Uncharacterized protein n=1 Tax=Glossina palpalis gambiensis TaxID=67801 RepID=A0A1B0ATP0_9MUSC
MEESACSSGKRTTTSKHLRHLLISDIYTYYSTTYLPDDANDRGMSCGRQLAVNGVSLLLLEHTTKFTQ